MMVPDNLPDLVDGLIFAGFFISVTGTLAYCAFSPKRPPARRKRVYDKRDSRRYRKELLSRLKELEEVEPGRIGDDGRYREGLGIIRRDIAKLERIEERGRQGLERVFDYDVAGSTYYNARRVYVEIKRDMQ